MNAQSDRQTDRIRKICLYGTHSSFPQLLLVLYDVQSLKRYFRHLAFVPIHTFVVDVTSSDREFQKFITL